MTFAADIEHLLGSTPHDGVPGPRSPGVSVQPLGGRDVALVGGAYEGASRFDREVALWSPPIFSADGDILPDKLPADARVRDTLRNDAYVAAGQDIHKDNIVGSMFLLNAKPVSSVLGLDEAWEKEFQEEVEAKFTLWAESPSNWVDASRMNTLTSLVRLAVGIFVASGEVLASVEWMKGDGRPFNTAVQMIDVDRLSDPRTYTPGPGAGMVDTFILLQQGLLRGGVERDTYGAPQAYWVQTRHPSDPFWNLNYPIDQWRRVPRTKPWGRLQMLHIIEQVRPDQTRGISAMVSALKELRITKRFRDVVLQNAVLNATYAATIESDLPSEQVFTQLGGGEVATPEAIAEATSNWAASYLGAVNEYSGGSKNLQIDGARIPHLFPGTKLQLRPAGQGGPLGSEFEQSLLRYIAANLGVSYEQLSKDYSQTNYSSVRAAMSETWKYMQSRKKLVADRFASSVYRLWIEEAINTGQLSSVTPKIAKSLYTDGVQNLNFDAITSCDWIGASRGQIDELKETQAAIQRILFGLSTWEDELGRLGKDWRKVFVQIQREQAERDARDILQNVGSDMANATTGAVRNKEPGEGDTDVGQEAK